MKVSIIGGAGFIGCNAAEFYAKKGNEVLIIDNLSRKGSESNLKYLQDNYKSISFLKGDITQASFTEELLPGAIKGSELVLHLAAQVAVTTSVTNPREDFNANALGTFNVLEAMRKLKEKYNENPVFIYTSTNKVYGKMEHIPVIDKGNEYDYESIKGIDENVPLDFYSPYGCSKGTGDQYTRDYARMYGLNTIVMRQSCIYGKRQFGVEDQGWVAWFTIANVLDIPVTIFGDGKQVRDVLFADDLVNAYELARQNISKTRGQVYNIGGGSSNKLSLLNLISKLEKLSGKKISPKFAGWRPGDQKVCIMDISKAERDFGWKPKISPEEGVSGLYSWIDSNKDEIKRLVFGKD